MQSFHDSFRLKAQTPDLNRLWMYIAEEYSKRDLTYETDKLAALNGLAKHFQINGLEGYIAGNWMASIRDMLLWQKISSLPYPRSTEYIAPSWSWASSPLSIGFLTLIYERKLNRRHLARICSITAEDDTSGQLLGGRLIVVGLTIALRLVGSLLRYERTKSRRAMWYLACERSSTLFFVRPDYEGEFETLFESAQKVTGLLWDVTPDRTRVQKDSLSHMSPYSSHIIILDHYPGNDNLYRRIGIAYINWSYQDKNGYSPADIYPPEEIEGMKTDWDWGLGKDWFKDAKLKKVTII